MANALYLPGKEGILDASISVNVAVIKAALVSGYTFSSAHKFMNEVGTAGGTVRGTPFTLGTKTFTNGVFDAADNLWAAVATAAACIIVIYQASAVTGGSDVANTAQRLIQFIDTGTNLPVTPNGGDINCTWDNGSNKIFAL